MITELDIKSAFRRLAAVYRRPDEVKLAMPEWRAVLKDFSPDELDRAVTAYMATDADWWPTPGRLRSLALAGREQYWREPEYEGPFVTVEELRAAWKAAGVLPPEYGQ